MAPKRRRSCAAECGTERLDDETLSIDDSPVSALAKKVAIVRKCGDAAKYSKKVAARSATVRVCDFLTKYEDEALGVWAHCEGIMRKDQADQKASAKADCWSSQYRHIWRIGAAWWGCWLIHLSPEHFTATVIEKFVQRQPDSPKRACYWVCQLSPDDALPIEMLDKQVASKVFTHRCRVLDRLPALLKAINFETGDINWDELGPFFVDYAEDGLSKEISYCDNPGEKIKIPADGCFYKDAAKEHWRIDTKALAKTRHGPIAMAGYWSDGEGPNKHALDKDGCILKQLASKFLLQISHQQAQAQKDIIDECAFVMPDLHAERRLAALAKARVMLINRKEEAKKEPCDVKMEAKQEDMAQPV